MDWEHSNEKKKCMTSNMPLAIFHWHFLFKFISVTLNAQIWMDGDPSASFLFLLLAISFICLFSRCQWYLFFRSLHYFWMECKWNENHVIQSTFYSELFCVRLCDWKKKWMSMGVRGVQCRKFFGMNRERERIHVPKEKGCYPANQSYFRYKHKKVLIWLWILAHWLKYITHECLITYESYFAYKFKSETNNTYHWHAIKWFPLQACDFVLFYMGLFLEKIMNSFVWPR